MASIIPPEKSVGYSTAIGKCEHRWTQIARNSSIVAFICVTLTILLGGASIYFYTEGAKTKDVVIVTKTDDDNLQGKEKVMVSTVFVLVLSIATLVSLGIFTHSFRTRYQLCSGQKYQ